MCPPFVVEEHDEAFWVHHQGYYDFEKRKRIMGELAYDKPFKSQEEVQMKASEMEIKTGVLW